MQQQYKFSLFDSIYIKNEEAIPKLKQNRAMNDIIDMNDFLSYWITTDI